MSKVLVTGGAGYIGSFIVRQLKSEGFTPVVIDDMSSGHEEAVKDFELVKLNLVDDKKKLSEFFKKEDIEGVIHMAAYLQVGESYKNPQKYFHNNIVGAINLFEEMVKNEIPYLIFSSSAAIFGNPESLPIKEEEKKAPLNPYGETKYLIERMLPWYDKAYGMKSVAIRYFNAAGAVLDGSVGEDHPEESHLIPLAIKAAMENREFTIFGGDYNTPDGTNVRDYVHVLDLSRAHTLALQKLMDGMESDYFNAGAGKGYSNKEVVDMIKEVSGLDFKVNIGPRRPGDADSLYASIDKIKDRLEWEPKFSLKEIVESAYKWHKTHPEGYSK